MQGLSDLLCVKRNHSYNKNHQSSLPVKYIVKILSLKVLNPKRSGFAVSAAGGVKGVEVAFSISGQGESSGNSQVLLLVPLQPLEKMGRVAASQYSLATHSYEMVP